MTRTTIIDGMCFGEGPRWHGGRLWVSDLVGGQVLAVDEAGGSEVVAECGDDHLSGLGFLPGGDLLVVAMSGRRVLRSRGGRLVPHADLDALGHGGVNDMVVRADGFAYVGQMGRAYDAHGVAPVPMPLLGVSPDGVVRPVAEDLRCANGMALTADASMLVVAESAGRCLTAFDVAADGSLRGRREFAALGGRDHPDGICLDAAGAAWVACPVGGRFIRVREGGEVTDAIEVERDRHAIACVLGGADRRTLYLVTAATLGDAARSRASRSSRVEAVRVAVPGAGTP